MNPDATMNEKTGKYQGLNRFECREKLVEDLDKQGLLIGVEKNNPFSRSFRKK